jgi:limonene-1,2-epoxide hydrolase
MSEALARVRRYFETLDEASLARIDTVYAPDAYFKDPFNEVRGIEAIRRIFARMLVDVETPRFVMLETIGDERGALLTWEFHFRLRRFTRAPQVVRGASHLRLAADGRIQYHRDYWDAAEELYEKLPLLGALMRWLKRRASL